MLAGGRDSSQYRRNLTPFERLDPQPGLVLPAAIAVVLGGLREGRQSVR